MDIYLFIIHHCQSVLLQRGGVSSVRPSHDQIWYKVSWKCVYTGNTVEKLLKPTRHFLFWECPWHRVISPFLSRRRGTAGECPPPHTHTHPRGKSFSLIFLKTYPGVGWGLLLGAWGVPKRVSGEGACTIFFLRIAC